ncbi:MAG: hydroxymethylglutaryl-CoA lyase [Bacteriovoracaceae bacterium]
MFANKPQSIKVVEVGPRDGLQNEKTAVPTDVKREFIQKLADAGLSTIEVTSFVRADKIPQMNDASALFPLVKNDHAGKKIDLPCLVPNMKGYELAKSLDVDTIALFSATSNTFNLKNINVTIDESFEKMEPIAKLAKSEGKKIRAYISMGFGCPYEGEIKPSQTLKIIERFSKLNVDEISIGDTIGVANPKDVQELCQLMKGHFDLKKMAMHFHDTRGTALTNVLVSLENDIIIFDSSAGGLGGCPYAKGATGNLATEDLVYLLHRMGLSTGIDMKKLSEASVYILGHLNKETASKYLRAFLNTGY